MTMLSRLMGGFVLVLLIVGCTSTTPLHDPIPKNLIEAAHLPNLKHVRFWDDTSSNYSSDERIALIRAHYGAGYFRGRHVEIEALSLSGGGEDGAFGAGLLVGWTDSGQRPEFEVVTGISTGALIAPLAFLGPRYDDELRQAYTTLSSDQLIRADVLAALFGGESVASSKPLATFIARYTSQKMLEEIAAEYRRGRMLLIGTTNLYAQRPVVWDLGALANSGRPDALTLMRQIILASASAPPALPPVHIDVIADGKIYDEMHVDGGVTREVFIYPPDYDPRSIDAALGWKPVRRVFIIRNSKVAAEYEATKPRLIPIATRSVTTLLKAQGLGDLYKIYFTTQRDNIDFNLAYIPADAPSAPQKPFDRAYMNALFKLGYSLGRNGYRWHKTPPGLDRNETH